MIIGLSYMNTHPLFMYGQSTLMSFETRLKTVDLGAEQTIQQLPPSKPWVHTHQERDLGAAPKHPALQLTPSKP